MTKTLTHRTIATIGLIGFVIGAYNTADVIRDLQTWQVGWQQPAVAADLIQKCIIPAVVAMAAAVGIDLKTVLGQGGKSS